MTDTSKYDRGETAKTTEEAAADQRKRDHAQGRSQPQTPGSPATPGSGSGNAGSGSPAGSGGL